MGMTFLLQTSRKPRIRVVKNFLPVPPGTSNRSRREEYEEWGCNGEEEGEGVGLEGIKAVEA